MPTANGKEYKLAIRIAGKVDKSLAYSLTSAKAQLKALDANFEKLDKGYNKIMGGVSKVAGVVVTGAKMAAGATIGVAAAATFAGSKFESAFAGVKKTVDATDAEYKMLREDVLGLSREIPQTADEIAKTMEIAGQLGIGRENKKELTDFTEVMINMGASTNMAAEEAASSLARFKNITQMDSYDEKGVSNYERLGSTIADLGNKFATTESEITNMALNIASAGTAAGFTEDQILALATTGSSLGLKAERGGTSISKTIKMLQKAVELQTPALKDYAKIAGMTADSFRELWNQDAAKAFSTFITGMGNTERNGKSVLAVISDLDIKEARWSDTLVRLSNAHGLMDDALEVANEAWGENTALAEEAGKRYETFESQAIMAGNAIVEMGIKIYDGLTRTPAMAVIKSVKEGIVDFTDNGLDEWIDRINGKIPTLVRNFKNLAKPTMEIAGGAGKWFASNWRGIASGVAGIGATLAAYKIESTIVHIAAAFAGLNPAAWALLGGTVVVGGIAAYATHLKLLDDQLVSENISSKFGDISLSMEELEENANSLLETGSLVGIRKQIEQLEELDGSAKELEKIGKALEKYEWKAKVGFKLGDEENEDYKQQTQKFIDDAQEYAENTHITTMAMFGEGELSDDLQTKINAYLAINEDAMRGLGNDLSRIVNEAFADGILDPEEVNAIANARQKLLDLEASMKRSEYENQITVSKWRNGSGDISAEAFKNQIDTNLSTAEELEEAINARYAAKLVAGQGLNGKEKKDFEEQMQNSYLNELSGVYTNGLNYGNDIVSGKWQGEITGIINRELSGYNKELDDLITGAANNPSMAKAYLGNMKSIITSSIMTNKEFGISNSAVSEFMDMLKPSTEKLEEIRDAYEKAGMKVPEGLKNGLEKAELWQGIADGNEESIWKYLMQYGDTEKVSKIEELYKAAGLEVPKGVASGIEDNKTLVTPKVQELYDQTQTDLQTVFGNPFSVEAKVNMRLNPIKQSVLDNPVTPTKHADGGFINGLTLSWLGEEGPESVIPLDGSSNAMRLWEQTGRLLGMQSLSSRYPINAGGGRTEAADVQQPIQVTFSPNITIQGNADQASVAEAMRNSYAEFERNFRQYMRNNQRLSYVQ